MTLYMTQTPTAVGWVRPPQQARSEESLERILDAAEETIAEKGFEQATVAEITRRAKSSVGAFYGRFHEKNGLLGCLHDRFMAEAIATSDAVLEPGRWAGASIAGILQETLPFLVDVYRQRRSLFRAFTIRASVDADFARRFEGLNDHLFAAMRNLLLERVSEIDHPSPADAIDIGFQMVLSTLDQAVLFDGMENRGITLDDPRLAGELVRMYLGYLRVACGAAALGGDSEPIQRGELV